MRPFSSSPVEQHSESPQSVQYTTLTYALCEYVCGSVRFPHEV